eukprot:g28708.t1
MGCLRDARMASCHGGRHLRRRALFAVFDGHGGSQVSHIASKEFPKVLQVCANKLQDGDSTEAEKEDGIGIPPLQSPTPSFCQENSRHAPLAALAVPNPKQRRESPSPASPRMPPGLSWPRLAPSSFGGFGVRRDWILKCVGVEEPENFCTSFFLGFSTCAGHAEVNEASFPSRPCISVGRSSISSTQDGKEDDKSTNGVEADIALKAAGGLCGKALSMSMIAMDAFLRQLGNSVNSKRNGLPLSSPLGMMARHLEAKPSPTAVDGHELACLALTKMARQLAFSSLARGIVASPLGRFLHVPAMRLGPKKAAKAAKGAPKGAAESAVPSGPAGAGQVFNIFAERPDEEIKPDSWYPNWLWKLETPPKHYGDSWHWKQAEMDLESRLWPLAEDLTLMFVHGVNIEEAPSCEQPKERLQSHRQHGHRRFGRYRPQAKPQDHKPELASEEQRIRLAGGSVKLIGPCHRIDGWGLNLSRALGDFHYKARGDLSAEEQKVIAIRTVQLHDDDEFLVLACDGCFELHTSQNVVDIVSVALRAGFDVKQAAEQLVDQSCSPNLVKTRGKGGDNCSAIIIKFR